MAQHSQFLSQVRVNKTYKKKLQKVQLVKLSLSNGSKPDGSDILRLDIMKKETSILDLIDKYTYLLILKFIFIVKKAKLTFE